MISTPTKPPNLLVSCSAILLATLLTTLSGCTHTVKVEPIEVKPIDITLHIYLEADQKLDDFFSDIEKPAAKTPTDSTQGTK